MTVVTGSELARAEREISRSARHLGAHYTPMPIVRRMVRAALGPLVEGLSPDGILRLRILDPAVGSGRFLRQALDVLADAAGRPDGFVQAVAQTCLYGVDVHAPSVRLARSVLAGDGGACRPLLEEHLRTADSLLTDLPGLFGVDAFDAVVTNPPWLSYSGRQAAALAASRRRALARRYQAFARWPTEHGAFLELAASLLAEGGRAALLVPEQVCHLEGYAATREALRRRCTFDPAPEPLGEGQFAGVVQPAAILHLRQGHGPAAPAVIAPAEASVQAILRRMRQHPCAPPRTFSDPGVHTGNSARLVVQDEPGPGRAGVREGRNVHPFALDEPDRWLTLDPTLPEGHYCRIGPADAYLGTRILLRQTADRPVAARHEAPTYFRNSVLACKGIDGVDDRALVALLNSTPVAFYHKQSQADSRQRAFPQVKVGHLASLPIPRDLGPLGPLGAALETLTHAGAQARRELVRRLAMLLGCPASRLAGRRGCDSVARGADPLALLARRVPEIRSRLQDGTIRHRVEEALEAFRRQSEDVSRQIEAAAAEVDAIVCRAYGLSPREAERVRGDDT